MKRWKNCAKSFKTKREFPSSKSEVTVGRSLGNKFEAFCNELGIKKEFSAPKTLQQNGVVERKNQVIQEMARVMLLNKDIPQNFGLKQ